jgi:hypothetical protein
MTILEIILSITSFLLLVLYVTSKFGSGQKLEDIVTEVKEDLKQTATNVADLVIKAKEIVFDESVQKAVKEFIMIVEEKNRIAKAKGEAFLSGDEKKKAVLSRISEWISNLTGSSDKALEFIDSNQSKIEYIIDEYISFSNKMQGKNTLSDAEKLIQEQLKK